MRTLTLLPCQDDSDAAARCKRELGLDRELLALLGRSAVTAVAEGGYPGPDGSWVDWRAAVQAAIASKDSLAPDAPLRKAPPVTFTTTRVQVCNESTMAAARRLQEQYPRVLALNFANGVNPGGGFLHGARAQEEALCRSSALYATLEGDPMYAAHRARPRHDSTPWAIYSPDVPFFRTDEGTPLVEPWLLSVVTCAAPVVPEVPKAEAADLLAERIRRVLAVAHAYGHTALVLGAWGCGAFRNDPQRAARDFRTALEGEFSGAFAHVVFAIADWSTERKYLGPFRNTFDA